MKEEYVKEVVQILREKADLEAKFYLEHMPLKVEVRL